MSASLGWSRSVLTGAVTVQSILSLVASPIIGIATDRYGPRLVMATGATIAAICYLALGQITEPWQLYVLYAIAVACGLTAAGPLVTETTVAKWFVRQRGRALAITAMGIDFGSIFVGPLTAVLAEALGWRLTWPLLGVLVALVLFPVAIAFMRLPRAPADGAGPNDAQRKEAASTERSWTAKEALRDGSLWKLILAFNLTSAAASALIYHLAAFFVDSGLTLQQASIALAINRTFAIGSKLIWGFLAERMPVRYCLAGNCVGRAMGFLILLLGSGPERAYVFAVVGGLSGNAFGPLQIQILADYYGGANLGAIRGMLAPFTTTTGLLGPLLAAVVRDVTGSYEAAFWIFTSTLLFSAAVTILARPPRPTTTSRVAS